MGPVDLIKLKTCNQTNPRIHWSSVSLYGSKKRRQKFYSTNPRIYCSFVHLHFLSGSGAIKLRRAHTWSQSHFSTICSIGKSETEIKHELVQVEWPRGLKTVKSHVKFLKSQSKFSVSVRTFLQGLFWSEEKNIDNNKEYTCKCNTIHAQ